MSERPEPFDVFVRRVCPDFADFILARLTAYERVAETALYEETCAPELRAEAKAKKMAALSALDTEGNS